MTDNDDRDPLRWLWRGLLAVAVLGGWLFILATNRFHVSAAVVFVCLGYLAVVATVYNLWRTGASAVTEDRDEDDSTWAKPAGEASELEREKRTLLKAIKEAEFDLQMGKLSQRDADDMIAMYKGRVYEVYRELDRLQHGTGSVRDQILREVKARLEVEARSKKPEGKRGKNANKAAAAPSVAEIIADAEASHAARNGGAAAVLEADVVPADSLAAHDEALDADSTTASEPVRDVAPEARGKEATP
ncbi:MAG TPA: hypothetical protein VFP84_01495 [Kofleriaceae bacterium]|nr:hypothetical protein [Kofleriaceae bacterium]